MGCGALAAVVVFIPPFYLLLEAEETFLLCICVGSASAFPQNFVEYTVGLK